MSELCRSDTVLLRHLSDTSLKAFTRSEIVPTSGERRSSEAGWYPGALAQVAPQPTIMGLCGSKPTTSDAVATDQVALQKKLGDPLTTSGVEKAAGKKAAVLEETAVAEQW